jgi:serine/threonine protein phosphatase PrpC
MPWQFSMASDIGGRSEQQDRIDRLSSASGDTHLVIVADGMGGHRDGALAAEKVIETAREHFHAGPTPDPGAFLEGLCLESHRAINNLGEDEQRSPGSTCVMLYLNGPEAYWAHVGDSRMYHFRGGELLNRTCDHSVAQLLVSEGRLNEADAASSPMQNQLYMRLGGNNMPIPELGASIVEDSEFFLLCSDGFWSRVTPAEVAECLRKYPLENDAAKVLVELARERGGSDGDNISLAITRWESGAAGTDRGLLAKLRAYLPWRRAAR